MGVCGSKPGQAAGSPGGDEDDVGSDVRSSKMLGDKFMFVIVGFGVAAGYAAKELADMGVKDFDVAIIGEEPSFAYERPALSKGYLYPPGNPDKLPARLPRFHTCSATGGVVQTEEWYQDRNWTCYLNTKVINIDLRKKVIKCLSPNGTDEWVQFEKLIVCTGSKPMKLTCTGSSLKNIYYLKTEQDAAALVRKFERETGNRFQDRKLAPMKGKSGVLQSSRKLDSQELQQAKDEDEDNDSNERAVVLGGGYLGVELACAAHGWGFVEVHLVLKGASLYQKLPWDETFRAKVQEEVMRRAPKLILHTNTTIKECAPRAEHPQALGSVVLEDGTFIETHTLLVAIGSQPCGKELFSKKAVTVLDSGCLTVEPDLRVKSPESKDVWACGELAQKECGVESARKMGQHAALCAFKSQMGQPSPGELMINHPFRYSRLFEYTQNPLIWYQIGEISTPSEGTLIGPSNVCGETGPFAFVYERGGTLTGATICGSMKEKETLDAVRRLIESGSGTLDGAKKLFSQGGYSTE